MGEKQNRFFDSLGKTHISQKALEGIRGARPLDSPESKIGAGVAAGAGSLVALGMLSSCAVTPAVAPAVPLVDVEVETPPTPAKAETKVATSEITPSVTITAVATGTSTVEPQASPTPEMSLNYRSPFTDIYFGIYGEGKDATKIGAIPGAVIAANNPRVKVPLTDGIDESRVNTLYHKDHPKNIKGFMIDQDWLMDIFGASDSKGGVTGKLPDGTEVKFINNMWVMEKGGQQLVFNPLTASQEGKPFGYPVLVQDKSTGEFLTGLVDSNGVLVEGSKWKSAFKSVSEIVRAAGFVGNLAEVSGVGLDKWGNIAVFDKGGKTVAVLPYLNRQAVILHPTYVAPPTVLSETPTEEPTAKPVPLWQTTLEIQDPKDKYFKITSKVIDGSEVTQVTVDLYDTPAKESVVLVKESIKMMKTNDGLNPNILTALDSEGNQYAFNPNYGWFMVPAEIQMDFNKYKEYTELPYRFFADGTANIILALKYAENPTISPDAATPHYWANYEWFKKVLYVDLIPSADGGDAYLQWPELSLGFKPEQKPFAWGGGLVTTLPSGEKVYVIASTIKNPTEANKDQLINLFHGFDEAEYERMANNILGDGKTTELKMMIDGANSRGVGDLKIILDLPKKSPDGTPISYDSAGVILGSGPNPMVAGLQKPGELILLFSEEDQKMIWQAFLSGLRRQEGKYVRGIDSWSTPLTSLPEELAKLIIHSGYR